MAATNSISALILEDDLKTLISIFEAINEVETKKTVNFSLTVLPDYKKVDKYINKNKENFDLVLLDRDCFLGGSFHILEIERIGLERVIGISSVPNYNEELRQKGVRRIVGKDYSDLKDFKRRLVIEILELVK